MGLPRTLVDMALFNEGLAYMGEATTVTLPTLTKKLEEYRGGGMIAPVSLDMGIEALELEATFGGPMRDILRQFGTLGVAGVYLRFVGAYQRQDTGQTDAIEIVVRGRHSEIGMGDATPGEPGEFTVKTAIAYYKLTWNGVTEIEIDPLNMVFNVGGVDQLAARRAALGL